MVAHCIEDDFNIFLDPQYHEFVPPEKRIVPDANFATIVFIGTSMASKPFSTIMMSPIPRITPIMHAALPGFDNHCVQIIALCW